MFVIALIDIIGWNTNMFQHEKDCNGKKFADFYMMLLLIIEIKKTARKQSIIVIRNIQKSEHLIRNTKKSQYQIQMPAHEN